MRPNKTNKNNKSVKQLLIRDKEINYYESLKEGEIPSRLPDQGSFQKRNGIWSEPWKMRRVWIGKYKKNKNFWDRTAWLTSIAVGENLYGQRLDHKVREWTVNWEKQVISGHKKLLMPITIRASLNKGETLKRLLSKKWHRVRLHND